MPKTAYLTIDDAPSPGMKSKVDFLKKKRIPAVWFCTGESLERLPSQALYAVRQGHVLGNHSYTHPYFSDLELEECFFQIQRTEEIIEALYQQAGVLRPMKCFRFPFGDKGGLLYSDVGGAYSAPGWERKQALQHRLREWGFRQPEWKNISYRYFREGGLQEDADWYWTYDVMEWSIHAAQHSQGIDTLQKVMARMEEDMPDAGLGLNRADSAEIILMHDHSETEHDFAPLVERLLEKGLTFELPHWE
jgi:peptidoglycan-N-acetylglucosamine deacetylase